MDPPPDCSPCYMKGDRSNQASNKLVVVRRKEISKEQDGGEYLDLTKNTGAFKERKTLVGHGTSSETESGDGKPSVRSSAVIAYSASKNNTMFSRLAPETNLNLAPSNWLRKTEGLRPETVLPGGRYTASPNHPFSGFNTASSHLDCVGKVDVVSDAENIKKLLKMPYSKAHVSMAIHRIGRTLLLENFDVRRYTAEESEWQWFRNFYQELVQQQGSNKLFKKKSPTSQYDRLMLSKFLYYSIYKDSFNELEDKPDDTEFEATEVGEDDENGTKSNLKLVEIDDKLKEVLVEDEERVVELASSSRSCKPEDEGKQVVMQEKRWRYWTPNEAQFQSQFQSPGEEFERNIRWTFEDLQMMLGTNMPIFGGGKYPAVSLRLRDSKTPINILTGIDYWLDNLICNVPELVMCFHVDGIVRNYEVIKTEDIPKLKHSSFSPQVVKDIAQNILSFLKSNCTKEGHTYWLFKGSGDDVVKLYDLTTLCNTTDQNDSSKTSQQNPYIFSVAMLLYKTAINLMQSNDTCDHRVTVKKLLRNCIDLLDETKYQDIIMSAICMLSTLCLPDPGLDIPTKENVQQAKDTGTESPSTSVDWKKCDTCSAHHDAAAANSRRNSEGPRNAEIASIQKVTDLSIPEKYPSISHSFNLMKTPPSRARRPHGSEQTSHVEDSCDMTLSYVVSGLEVLIENSKETWKHSLLRQLTRNSALAYFRLAEQASHLGKLGRKLALQRSRLALHSYETFDFLAPSNAEKGEDDLSQAKLIPPDFHLLLPRLLSLCGEVQFGIVQDIRTHEAVTSSHEEEYESLTLNDKKIENALNQVLKTERKFERLTKMSTELEQALTLSAACYESALEAIDVATGDREQKHSSPAGGTREGKSKGKRSGKRNEENTRAQNHDISNDMKGTLLRRHGHVINELGAFTLNEAVTMLSEQTSNGSPNQKIWDKWNAAGSSFDKAHIAFVRVGDTINQALVLSNMGRLMRVCAQFYSNNEEGQLSKQERKCFATAIDKYQKALALLRPQESRRECPTRSEGCETTCLSVYDNISWELSSCFFSMAQILQDNAPRDTRLKQETEKEVISLMNESLKACKDIWENTPKQSIVIYRQAKIHHRMASLHHNSYRNCSNDTHRCKQLRNLAERHYNKSLTLFEGLEHPNELIRVQLERLSLKEHQIASTNNQNSKIRLLTEGLGMICECRKPLKSIEKSTKISVRNPSQNDAKEPSPSSEFDVANMKEISGLLRIMATILETFLLSMVKLTSISSNSESSDSRKGRTAFKLTTHTLKGLYSSTLRSLQKVKYDGDVEEECTPVRLREDVCSVLGVLDNLSANVNAI